MIHKQGVPIAPFTSQLNVAWEVVDGAYVYPPVATIDLSFDKITPYGRIFERTVSVSMESDALSAEEKLQLYGLLAKVAESQSVLGALNADEYVPPVVELPVEAEGEPA